MARWFEDFVVGEVIPHATSRTVTEMDNVLFSSLTMNVQPLHIDEDFAATTAHGRRVVNGVFTLGLVTGMSVPETVLGTTLGVLSMDLVEFASPVFHGDTIHAETEILSARPSRSRPDTGIVEFEHRGYNQHDTLVLRVRRHGLMMRRPDPRPDGAT